MSNWKVLAGSAALGALMAGIVQPAEAQLTSSNVTGRVVDNAGAAVAGATVTITHQPTGSTSTAVTSDSGVYFASGLRVGGPYVVTVAAPSGAITREGVFFQPGVGNTVDLRPTVDVVTITGSAVASVSLNNGVGSSYTGADIINQPSIARDLTATLARDPLASRGGTGVLSVAGANPRFNGLAIDGTLLQDDFGLSSSTYPTARSPINLDAVESASLVASDYSVTASGFTGGLVNVVTKSGTNRFSGSAFYYYRDEDFVGNSAYNSFVTQAPFKEKEYGVTLGGPIIQDKLFFFASYDKFETGAGVNFASQDAAAGLNPELFTRLNEIVRTQYGYDMGGRPTTAALPEYTERYLGKIDWNINDRHRASLTYSQTEEANTSVNRNWFTSAWYSAPAKLENYSAQLFSDWTDNLSTEFRISNKQFTRDQVCNAGVFPEIQIILERDELIGTPLEGMLTQPGEVDIRGGCDRSRHANKFSDERTQIYGALNYTFGDHFLTAGAEWEDYSLFNLFAERTNGVFVFGQNTPANRNAYNDLMNRNAFVLYRNAPSNDANDIAAAWGSNKLALFVQDQWQIHPDLRLDLGVRYERFIQDDRPSQSAIFQATYGFNSDNNLDGKDLIQPRLGFEYKPAMLPRTTVSGGLGLFAGGDPKVWTSNSFSPFFAEAPTTLFSNVSFDTIPQAQLNAVANTNLSTLQPIDVIDPSFDIPSDWKASVKVDQEFDLNFGDMFNFGSNYLVSAQILHTRVNKGFQWRNIAQTQLASTQPQGVAPDGRPIFADLNALGIRNVTMLTNFDGGKSTAYSLALSKAFENGFDFYASYAYQDIETRTEGTSSRGVSNWNGISALNRNYPELGRAPFETEHAFKLGFGYEKEIFGTLLSEFRVFGQFNKGSPYSYMFDIANNNALFGRAGQNENPFDNVPLYSPSRSGGSFNDPNVVFRTTFNQTAFYNFAEAVGLPNGGVDQRYNRSATWNQKWDFQYAQELPFSSFGWEPLSRGKVKFTLDVENIANLLNDEWGTQYNVASFGQVPLITADLVTRASVAANGVNNAPALLGDAARTACTTEASCVYRFNTFTARPNSIASLTGSVYRIRAGLRFEF